MKPQYIIVAFNSAGQVLYYWENSNGETMTPNAGDLAERFNSRHKAAFKSMQMREVWKGLRDWTIERV